MPKFVVTNFFKLFYTNQKPKNLITALYTRQIIVFIYCLVIDLLTDYKFSPNWF